MDTYFSYHFWGMNSIWWFVWIFFILWVFATPYNIPGQRLRKDSPLNILKKRFASGQIEKEEFLRTKKLLE
jgi:putative membrane protein